MDVPVHARRLAVQVGDVRIEDDARGRAVLQRHARAAAVRYGW
jgi:hypothetical protein